MTDLISRQDAIALLAAIDTADYTPEDVVSECIEALTNMPSANTDAAKEYLGRRILAEFEKP